jgi:PRTRC genetic system protein E
MFKELSPLLTNRSLVLTIVKIREDLIRVTVTPLAKNKDEPEEVIQPYIVEGTVEEQDAHLAQELIGYTCELLTHERAMTRLKADIDKAQAEARAEASKKAAEARSKTKPAATAVTTPKVEERKPEPAKAPATANLFEMPAAPGSKPEPTSVSAGQSATSAETKPSSDDTYAEEEEILKESYHAANYENVAA